MFTLYWFQFTLLLFLNNYIYNCVLDLFRKFNFTLNKFFVNIDIKIN